MGNQQCNRHLHFPGQHYSFQGFFQTFPYLWSFSILFKDLKISILNSRTIHTFPGSVRTRSRNLCQISDNLFTSCGNPSGLRTQSWHVFLVPVATVPKSTIGCLANGLSSNSVISFSSLSSLRLSTAMLKHTGRPVSNHDRRFLPADCTQPLAATVSSIVFYSTRSHTNIKHNPAKHGYP